MLSTRVNGFVKAIEDELAAIREDGGNQVFLHDRKHLGPDRFGNHYYQFRADGEVALPDDSPIEVKTGRTIVQGSLVSAQGFRVIVHLEEELPKAADDGDVLITDPTFLLEGLKERLLTLRNADGAEALVFNTDLALELLSTTPTRSADRPVPEIDAEGLNAQQLESIRTAFRRDFSFIWGPPGTGKTGCEREPQRRRTGTTSPSSKNTVD